MGKSESPDTVNVPSKPDGDLMTLSFLGTIADTTWRMFVPSVGFTLLGVWLDSLFNTKPWLMFIGIAVGVLFAALLVKKQLVGIRSKK